ncbi:MAG: hypothetical protein H0T46_37720 [Deltaproteobacteria bacterium]|nr:hypothetical protein [Deltaproteobacteria bacterium]
MKAKGWITTALVAGGVVFAVKTTGGCLNQPAPDQRLAGQFEDLCDIARKGAEKPVAGVKSLGRYMVKHGGDIAKNLVDTVALIERIRDDEAHDERARVARDRMLEAACPADWQAFDEAINDSPEAIELLNKAGERLSRTLEIILGPGAKLRDLPQILMHRLGEQR